MLYAECYNGIKPLDTLADIKSYYPGATFTKLNLAWAKDGDVIYNITGAGISGTIMVKFNDNRHYFRTLLNVATDSTEIAWYKSLVYAPEDNITVDWVRWTPTASIPLQRYINKYGQPEISDYREDNMMPFRKWNSREITAYLSDDLNNVIFVDFNFTIEEEREAHQKRYGFVPDYLQSDDNNIDE